VKLFDMFNVCLGSDSIFINKRDVKCRVKAVVKEEGRVLGGGMGCVVVSKFGER
jgi:hypothetical protein